jgi:cytochrome c2
MMKNSKIAWTDQKLHEFLTSPISYLSGTNMGFAGPTTRTTAPT